jgi:hypothetical protein
MPQIEAVGNPKIAVVGSGQGRHAFKWKDWKAWQYM